MSYFINKNDLKIIVSDAKRNMSNFNLPLYVTNTEVDKGELPSIAILESALMFLNSKKLLTEQVSLDYTVFQPDYEEESNLESDNKNKPKA